MKRCLSLLMCICIVLPCVGCSVATEVYTEENIPYGAFRPTVLYYVTDSGNIIPIMRRIPWDEGIAVSALSYLTATPENEAEARIRGLRAVIPEGTAFALKIDDNKHAVLDVENMPALPDSDTERVFLQTVVNTLTEFASIETVSLTFDGKVKTALAHGTNVDSEMRQFMLNPRNIELETAAQGINTVSLYIPDATCCYNVPVTGYSGKKADFETAMELFCECCESIGNGLPEGTHIISAAISEGTAAVNFSSEFAELQGTADGVYEAVFDAVYLTAKEYGDVSEVRLYADSGPTSQHGCSLPLYVNEW